MRPQPLHTSVSIPLDYASKRYVDCVLVLAIPAYIMLLVANLAIIK